MALKDLAALYGRVALIVVVFAFVAGIIAGPVLQKVGLRSAVTAAQDQAPVPELIRTKAVTAAGGQG
jgi:hypothetical protein